MARKSKKRSPRYKKYLTPTAIVGAVLVLLIGGVLALALHHNTSPTPASSAGQTVAQNGRPPAEKNYSTTPLNNSQVNTNNDSRKTSSVPSSTLDNPTPSAGSLHVVLTGISPTNGAVHVATLVSGTSSGTCQVTASLAGHSNVTASSSVVQNVNSYQCDDFGLKTSQFASGNWYFVVTVSRAGQSASDNNYYTSP